MATTKEKPRTTATTAATATLNPKNWSELPKHLLVKIARHLDFTTDIPRFRGVCPGWRKSLPLTEIPKSPSAFNIAQFKVPPLDNNGHLILRESHFYFLSPLSSDDFTPPYNGGWIARVANLGDNLFHLFNPLNVNDYFFPTPPIIGGINLLDCRILELAKPMTLLGGPNGPLANDSKPVSKKVVGGFDIGSAHVFSILAQLVDGGLIFWRLRDKYWTFFDRTFQAGDVRIFDIAYYNRKYYAFSLIDWKVGLIDPAKPGLVTMEFIDGPGIMGGVIDDVVTVFVDGVNYSLKKVHFVVSNEKKKLYLVVEAGVLNSEKRLIFVFVLTKEDKWEIVRRLADHDEILFIGYDVSFTLPSARTNLPQWDPATICLFTRPFPLTYDGCVRSWGQEMPEGTECLDKIKYVEYWKYYKLFVMDDPDDDEEEENVGIVEFEMFENRDEYTALFFPPPGWVKWTCPSLGDAEVEVDKLKFHTEEEQFQTMMKNMNVTEEDLKAALLLKLQSLGR